MPWLILVFLLLFGSIPALAQPDPPTFETAPCRFNRPGGVRVECGYVTVPEFHDPARDTGRTIRLAVAVFRSLSAQPEPDPIIYLDGGPGGRTLDTLEFAAAGFQPFMQNRDVIFFDQRGVGLSAALDCPQYTEVSYDILAQDLDFAAVIQLTNDTLLECRDQLLAEDVNLEAYTSAESAADVRALVTALGYEQVNLLGISYGTKLALTVMRDHPDIVRSAILDAVVPVQVNLNTEFLPNAQRAFTTLFNGCAADPACNQLYPNLESVFYETVDRLNAAPETISTFDFYTGQNRELLINGDTLIVSLFSLLYQTNEIPNLPRYIYEARDGRYRGFVDDALFTIFQGRYFDEGMFTAVRCNEETPFEQPETALASGPNAPAQMRALFLTQIAGDFELCAVWGGAELPDSENAPVSSDIPTLITSGEYDPITPPAWGDQAAATLTNSQVFTFPGVGHSTLYGSTCAADLMVAFVNAPGSDLDAGCLANVPPPLFAVTEISAVSNREYINPQLGFRSVAPENWFEVEPGVLSPYPQMQPVAIPVIAFRFPVTLDDYVNRIITNGFYAYDALPSPLTTLSVNGRDWQIYQVERPDEAVYASFAFFDGDQPYVIGLTATTAEERAFLYDALLLPAVRAFEPLR
jgi:pimeloyl-ACP methyl ester carboxylesterase